MTTNGVSRTNDADSLSVIQSDLASSIYVEAGAGTGKTHSLVQRITALLRGGVPIDQIIAITFTRAAASELRSRIRGELEKLRADNPNDQHVAAALEGIDTAAFQTIDSLVYSILREHPLDADLPPAIEVQDNLSQLQMFGERWRQWSLEQLETDTGFAEALTASLRLNLGSPFGRISDLAKSMNEKHGDLRHVALVPSPQIAIHSIENLPRGIQSLRETMQACSDPEDKLFNKFEQANDWYSRSIEGRQAESEGEAQELLVTWPNIKVGKSEGRQGNWGGSQGKAAALEVIQSFIDTIQDTLNAAREAVTIELSKYARQFVDTVVEERRRTGTVSYYDAMTWLVDMLDERDDIRWRLQNRYQRVLVDEFQDTDPNQVRLVRLLTIPPRENYIKPGSLFVVGDPKQSIYRFRGAQVNVSQAVKDDITNSGGKYLTLKENRRSTRPIIDWVNHVFEDWMLSEDGQANYIALDRAKETATPDDIGAVHHFGEEIADSSVDEVREIDAGEVGIIARAVCAGALTVRDRQNDDKPRPSHAGDLTILTNTRSNWETYTRELDELGLPYSAEIGGAAVLHTQEFRDILNCLTAMDDPSDQPATVGALKSVFFGCSDLDLFEWDRADGEFSCTAEFPKLIGKATVHDAMAVLREYNTLRDELSPAVLLERFIRERQTRELMYLETDPAPGLRRLDLAVELTRRFTEEGAASLRECLKRFTQFKDANQDLREEPSLEFDQGKIRLMTMHASKGLEFPIVILADLCGSPRKNYPELLTESSPIDGSNRSIGIRIGGNQQTGYFQTGDYEDLLGRNSLADSLEKTRLLYVAATRARDYLLVSRNRKAKDRKNFAAQIEYFVEGDNSSLWSPFPREWQTIEYEHHLTTTETSEADHHTIDRDSWMREHQVVLSKASERAWLSPSNIKGSIDTTADIEFEDKPDDTPIPDSEDFTGRGRAATKIGSAVHAAIQRVLEIPNANIDQIARSEAEKHGVGEDVDEVARLTEATLQMPLVQKAASLDSENVWIETPVAVPLPTSNGSSKTIEGRVDLIYLREDGTLGIADFKTDRSFNRSITEMAAPYIPQLGAYAYAVQQATGIPVKEASILFSRLAADRNGDGEFRLPDMSAAIEMALKLASNQ